MQIFNTIWVGNILHEGGDSPTALFYVRKIFFFREYKN